MPQRKVKAKYRTTGPHKVKVVKNMASMVKQEGTDSTSMEIQKKVVECEMYNVYFPQGHSIRVDRAELIRMGYHLKPRLIDMETGDVVDIGGDPYDFIGDVGRVAREDDPDYDFNLVEELENEQSDDDAPKAVAKK